MNVSGFRPATALTLDRTVIDLQRQTNVLSIIVTMDYNVNILDICAANKICRTH